MICREAKSEDEKHWNDVVNESLNGTFYHTWEWKEVIEKGLDSESYSLVVESEDKLVGVFLLFVRNAFEDSKIDKYLPYVSKKFQIGCSPHQKLYSFGGPCVPTNIEDSERIYNMMFELMNRYTQSKKSIIDHWIYPYYSGLDPILIQNGYIKRRNKKTTIIDIEKDLDEILKGFKKQFSKDIKRASRSEVTVYESQNYIEDVDLYYKQFQKSLINRIIEQTDSNYGKVSNALIPYSYFEAIRDILFPKKMARIFFAEYNGTKIGAQINFYHKDTIYLGHTSVLRGYNDLNASKLLIWHSIVDGKRNGFKKLDLAGLTPDESHGQYKFKMGFNGQIKEIGEYKKTFKYKRIKQLKRHFIKMRVK